MVDLLISIVDRLWALFKARGERRESLFKDYVEPIFSDMTTIHNDYYWSLGEIYRRVEGTSISKQNLLRLLKERHDQLKPLREKVYSFSKVYCKEIGFRNNDPIIGFLAECISYFEIHSSNSYSSAFSTLYEEIEYINSRGRADLQRATLELINKVRESRDSAWKRVSQRYAKARIEYLTR